MAEVLCDPPFQEDPDVLQFDVSCMMKDKTMVDTEARCCTEGERMKGEKEGFDCSSSQETTTQYKKDKKEGGHLAHVPLIDLT